MLNKNPANRPSLYAMFMIFAVLLVFNFTHLPGNILSWDFFGYYLYLPFTFIYHDLGFNNQELIHHIVDKYNSTASLYMLFPSATGDWIDKYPIGNAILNLPFFFIGHLWAHLFGYEADGFSAPYQFSILAGSIFYTFLGIYFLRKVLLKFFNDTVTIAVLFIIVFGTNFIIHTSFQGTGTLHNYLFMYYAMILWLTIRWHEDFKMKHALLLGLVMGLTIICRASELICVMIPLLWGIKNFETLKQKWNLIRTHFLQIMAMIIVMGIVILPQLLYWKVYAGKFFFNSYGNNAGEGFEFFHPYILELLFSFRKGWFIYTPIMIFSVIGFINLFKRNREIFWSLFLFFIVNIYVVGSWSCWWFAESFSQRSLIQSYPIMALPLGYFIVAILERNKRSLKFLMNSVFTLLIAFNMFQSWQYSKGIIAGSRMTKDYYFAVFGATEYDSSLDYLLKINRSFDGKEVFTNESDFMMKNLGILDFENPSSVEKHCDTLFHSGHSSLVMDSITEYSPAISKTYTEITSGDYAWIRITVYVYSSDSFKQNPASIIATFEHKGYSYKYSGFDIEKLNLEPHKWNKIIFDYLTPEVRRPSDILKVYVWHRGKKTLFIDDLRVDAYEPKK